MLKEFLSSILANEVSLETHNSQYLQRHSSSAPAVLAASRVAQKLGAAREEVEAILFTTLQAEVQLDIKVGVLLLFRNLPLIHLQTARAILSVLKDVQSPRQDEYRTACDAKFELSTVFKPSNELEVLRKEATKGDNREELDKLEVVG